MDENLYLKTNIGLHFLDCLSFSKRQISLVGSDAREWPWTILGLAALVQSVCALYLDERDTMEVATLSDSNMGKTIAALQHDSTTDVPKPYMAPPKELLKRVLDQDDEISFLESSRKDLQKLFSLRNDFTHLTPKSWAIETTGLPRISEAAFLLVKQVLLKPGLYSRISCDKRKIALALCSECMEYFDNS